MTVVTVCILPELGRALGELRPLPRRAPRPAELIALFRALPPVDPGRLRRDIDTVLDQRL